MGRVFVKAEAMHAPQSLMFDRAGVPLITSAPSTPLKNTKNEDSKTKYAMRNIL